ncbi:MAG TPA: DUF6788 family protein [Dehalococcoidia bacterium]|nr:DUF6788 family protein [Dehalococcoidia bacterium]
MRHRFHLSERQRKVRSRICALVHDQPLIRGTLTVLRNRCGNPNCKCARGEKHESLYLVQSRQGRRHARCIPKELRPEVSAWVAGHQKVEELLEEISQDYWGQLDNPQRKRQPR